MTFKDIGKSIYKIDHLVAGFLLVYNLRYVINPAGHDYLAYFEGTTSRLPISYLINFAVKVGGMNGLYAISFIASVMIYAGFYRKATPRIKPFVSLILLLNPSFQYMTMGVLQNLIAFAFWVCFEQWAWLLLPMIHLPTTVYFALVKYLQSPLSKGSVWRYLALMISAVILNVAFPSNFFRTVFYVLKWETWIKTAFFYGQWSSYLLFSTMILFWVILDKFIFSGVILTKSALKWVAVYGLVFAYFWHWHFMARIVYISFFPLTHALIELKPSRIYLVLLGLGFILI